MSEMTPREIVSELNKHIIGQQRFEFAQHTVGTPVFS
ncbi:hypothetical protein, partial [Citrobacter youngae]